MAFTAQDVKELREQTNCGMMDCKKALTATDGDMEKAIEFLREKGLAAAAKKAGRIAAEGIVHAYSNDGVAVLVEVNSETDFVAKNEEFKTFVNNVAKQIAVTNPANVEALLAEKFIDNDKFTISDMLTEKISTIGENMNIRRFERYEGVVETYIHGGGRIGVMVQFDTDADTSSETFKAFAKDIAMQIAAAMPTYLDPSAVPADVLEKEKEILKAQALNEGKPEAIVEKMVVGRINKYYKEVCLIEQPYIKDQDKNVKTFIKETAAALNANISVTKFTRFEKGEGIQKREDDFAAEVANMVK